MSFEKSRLAVHQLRVEVNLSRRCEVPKFCANHLGRNMSFPPLVKPNVRGGIIELLLSAVQKLHVVIVDLPILFGLPKLPQVEITQNLLPGIGILGPVYKGQEQLLGCFDVRRTYGDVEESKLRQCRKQAGVGHEMSLKAIETQEPRVNKAESDHRRERRLGSEEQRELVDKIALSGLRMDGAGVPFRGQECLIDVQFP